MRCLSSVVVEREVHLPSARFKWGFARTVEKRRPLPLEGEKCTYSQERATERWYREISSLDELQIPPFFSPSPPHAHTYMFVERKATNDACTCIICMRAPTCPQRPGACAIPYFLWLQCLHYPGSRCSCSFKLLFGKLFCRPLLCASPRSSRAQACAYTDTY